MSPAFAPVNSLTVLTGHSFCYQKSHGFGARPTTRRYFYTKVMKALTYAPVGPLCGYSMCDVLKTSCSASTLKYVGCILTSMTHVGDTYCTYTQSTMLSGTKRNSALALTHSLDCLALGQQATTYHCTHTYACPIPQHTTACHKSRT